MNALRIIASCLVLATVGGLFLLARPVHAEIVMTPELTQQVRDRCVENQATLNRLHQADAFLRNDRGDLYRTISDKLMVPLNRRLADNQLDGSALIAITADYNKTYSQFYDDYIAYDNALSKVLKIDCTKEPVTFYTTLIDARQKRYILSNDNQALIKLIKSYGTEFDHFHTSFLEDES